MKTRTIFVLVFLHNFSVDVKAMLTAMARDIRDDTSGAEIVEYAVMIGLLTAATIATIVLVAGWVAGEWSVLCANVNGNGGISC